MIMSCLRLDSGFMITILVKMPNYEIIMLRCCISLAIFVLLDKTEILIPPPISYKTRLLLCILWKGCCIRPVPWRVLLPLWSLVSHSRGWRDNRRQLSQRSLLSSGLLSTAALSHRTLQQQNQKQWSLGLPALSCRFDLFWHLVM